MRRDPPSVRKPVDELRAAEVLAVGGGVPTPVEALAQNHPERILAAGGTNPHGRPTAMDHADARYLLRVGTLRCGPGVGAHGRRRALRVRGQEHAAEGEAVTSGRGRVELMGSTGQCHGRRRITRHEGERPALLRIGGGAGDAHRERLPVDPELSVDATIGHLRWHRRALDPRNAHFGNRNRQRDRRAVGPAHLEWRHRVQGDGEVIAGERFEPRCHRVHTVSDNTRGDVHDPARPVVRSNAQPGRRGMAAVRHHLEVEVIEGDRRRNLERDPLAHEVPAAAVPCGLRVGVERS